MSVDVSLHPAGQGYRVSGGYYGDDIAGRGHGTHWLSITSRDGQADLHDLTPESMIELGERIKAQGMRFRANAAGGEGP